MPSFHFNFNLLCYTVLHWTMLRIWLVRIFLLAEFMRPGLALLSTPNVPDTLRPALTQGLLTSWIKPCGGFHSSPPLPSPFFSSCWFLWGSHAVLPQQRSTGTKVLLSFPLILWFSKTSSELNNHVAYKVQNPCYYKK